jgi:ATPase family associated with various cellular activities (AAA)
MALSNDIKQKTPSSNWKIAAGSATDLASAPRPNSKHDELRLMLNSRNPIITVETTEEERLRELLLLLATELGVPLYTWSAIGGLAQWGGAPLYGTDQPEQALANIALIKGDAIFLLKDFARYCENDRISRRLRDLAARFRVARRSLVITAASMNLPPELQSESAAFDLGLPDADELLPAVRKVLADANRDDGIHVALDAASVGQLAHNLVGLPQEEAMRVLRKCLLECRTPDRELLDAVLDAKRVTLHTDGPLESVRRDASFTDIAGLTRLREWLDKRRSALTPEGRRFGLVPPKGVLITGVQGCGKSLAARAVAGEWNVDLARLDVGALYDKYVGESEKRLHKALQLAEKLAPIVLWIDEIEKAFASAGATGDADAGLSQRLLATFLTWMQDHQSEVFLAATSNNIVVLPPEMTRKGRFDEIFSSICPSRACVPRFSLCTSKSADAIRRNSTPRRSRRQAEDFPERRSSRRSSRDSTRRSTGNSNSQRRSCWRRSASHNRSA